VSGRRRRATGDRGGGPSNQQTGAGWSSPPGSKIYIRPVAEQGYTMFETTYRLGLFTLYQFALVFGIILMPLALLARRLGVTLPVGEAVDAIGDAYERAAR
jgi:hypothetical protein